MLKIRKGCTPTTRKCHKASWNYGTKKNGPEMPLCCLKHLREIIWYLSDLFEEQEIPYWIDFGTLLGAVRDNRTVPFDTDGDFCLFVEDRPKILKLRSRMVDDGFDPYVRKPLHAKDNHIKICRSRTNHMTVDLFFWTLNPSKRTLHSPGLNAPKFFPDWWVQKFERVNIFDKPVWAPRSPKKFLQMRFGPDWNKPQNRKVHHGAAAMCHKYGFTYATKRGWVPESNGVFKTTSHTPLV